MSLALILLYQTIEKLGGSTVDEALRRSVRVLMSTGGEDAITEVFKERLQKQFGTRYDFQVREIPYATKFLEYAETQPVDLFVIVLNNMIPDAQERFPGGKPNQALQIISYLKEKYRKPVIALAGWWPPGMDIYAEAQQAGPDHFLVLPPDSDAFDETVRECLERIG